MIIEYQISRFMELWALGWAASNIRFRYLLDDAQEDGLDPL